MPRSKRNREVTLTKTKSKGLTLKKSLVEDVRKCLEDYKYVYVVELENPRNQLLKDVREEWKDSKFFFGKNNVLQIALGRTEEEEQSTGLAKLADKLKGQRGLLLTNRPKTDVVKHFKSHKVSEYARSGFRCKETIRLDAGPLVQFSHSIEPHLRQLGLPTSLVKGVVTLIKDHTVCEKGDVLTPEQCRILKLLEIPMAQFRFRLHYLWARKTGKIKKLGRSKETVVTGDKPMSEAQEIPDAEMTVA